MPNPEWSVGFAGKRQSLRAGMVEVSLEPIGALV